MAMASAREAKQAVSVSVHATCDVVTHSTEIAVKSAATHDANAPPIRVASSQAAPTIPKPPQTDSKRSREVRRVVALDAKDFIVNGQRMDVPARVLKVVRLQLSRLHNVHGRIDKFARVDVVDLGQIEIDMPQPQTGSQQHDRDARPAPGVAPRIRDCWGRECIGHAARDSREAGAASACPAGKLWKARSALVEL